jgi:hypothetical protein
MLKSSAKHRVNQQSRPQAVVAMLAAISVTLSLIPLSNLAWATGPTELEAADISTVCAANGSSTLLGTWAHDQTDVGGVSPFGLADSKWGTLQTYIPVGLVSTKAATAANLTDVPSSFDAGKYISYRFTTGSDTRIVFSDIRYGDNVATAFDLRATLFKVSGGSATAVTGATKDLSVRNDSGYFFQDFDFPDILLVSNQQYELRMYVWHTSSTLNGYDDVSFYFKSCLPAPPTVSTATGGAGSATIAFTDPTLDGGSSISNYQYSINGGAWVTPSPAVTSSPLTISGLSAGNADIVLRTQTTAGFSIASNQVSATITAGSSPPAPSASSPTRQLQHVATLPTRLQRNNQTVRIFGANFDAVTQVFIGGVQVEVVRRSDHSVEVQLPQGMSGLLDVEIRSSIGTLSLNRHLRVPASLIAPDTRRLVIRGFDHNSRVLSEKMKRQIASWIKANPGFTDVSCTGFTSLPAVAIDSRLSKQRGSNACRFAKSQSPKLKVNVRPGKADTRFGQSVRRVELVLSK